WRRLHCLDERGRIVFHDLHSRPRVVPRFKKKLVLFPRSLQEKFMATTYAQAAQPLSVTTPLGKDVLLLVGFTGHEAISQLFGFQLDLVAKSDAVVAFEKLLGQKITIRVTMPGGKNRYFNGICNRVSQGHQDRVADELFTAYRLEIVPQFW